MAPRVRGRVGWRFGTVHSSLEQPRTARARGVELDSSLEFNLPRRTARARGVEENKKPLGLAPKGFNCHCAGACHCLRRQLNLWLPIVLTISR